MKITIDELNDAYTKVNKLKVNGHPSRAEVEVTIQRNPLSYSDYFENDPDANMEVTLTFKSDPNLGSKGAYVLQSDVEIIDNEN